MPKNLGLSSPLYEIPFDDNTLLVVGRIALLWGQIIFHLEKMVCHLRGMSREEAAEYEKKPLRTKLTDLWNELSKPFAEGKARRAMIRVHEGVSQLSSDRNVVFHGLWGYLLPRDGNEWRSAAKSHSRDEPFFADDLKALHERMVRVSEALDDAYHALCLGHDPQPIARNRAQMWTPKEREPPYPPTPRKHIR